MKQYYSTAIIEIRHGTAAGKYMIAGSVPASCFCTLKNRSKIFETKADALSAVNSDPFVMSQDNWVIQA